MPSFTALLYVCSVYFCLATSPPIVLSGRPSRMPVGLTLSPILGADCRSPFVDVFKASTRFRAYAVSSSSLGWPGSNPVIYRPDGYPAAFMASSIVVRSRICLEPGVEYRLLHDGQGSLWMEGALLKKLDDKTYNVTYQAGTFLPTYDSQTPAPRESVLMINVTTVSDPLRNIRIIPATMLPSPPTFRARFLDTIRRFELLKFTEWQHEQDTGWPDSLQTRRDWQLRTTTQHQTQVGPVGVALEYIIELANLCKKPIWINTPFGPSAEWLGNFTTSLYSTLDSSIQVYVENTARVSYGSLQLHAQKSLVVFAAFKAVFPRDRLILVIGTYLHWLTVSQLGGDDVVRGLDIDAFAMEGKFGFPLKLQGNQIANIMAYQNLTIDDLFAMVREQILWDEISYNEVAHRTAILGIKLFASASGLSLMAARWGYRMAQKQPEAQVEQYLSDLMYRFHSDPRVKDLYIDFLRRWQAIGAGVWVAEGLHITPLRCDCGQTAFSAEDETLWTRSQCQDTGLLPMSWVEGPKWLGVMAYLDGTLGALPFAAVPRDAPQDCTPPCKWGSCVKQVCQCYRGWTGATCMTRTEAPNDCTPSASAANLDGLADYTPAWVFVDGMRSARRWVSQKFPAYITWDAGFPIQTRPDGYPAYLGTNEAAGTLLYRDLNGHYPDGLYTVFYEGDGIITLGMDAVVLFRDIGYMKVNVTPTIQLNNGIFIRIERTNPADPIRNIRVILPGFEETYDVQPFHPWFLLQHEKFRVLRFMSWMGPCSPGLGPNRSSWGLRNETDSTPRDWAARNTPAFMTQAATDGVSLEFVIQLANELHIDPWLNVPHLATDDYLEGMAKMLAAQLHPDAKIYVEHGNEVWATSNPCGVQATTLGAPYLNASMYPVGYNNQHKSRVCFNGYRSKVIWTNFEKYFPRNRTVRVLGTQFGWSDTTRWLLECNQAGTMADVLAFGPYFSAPVLDTNGKELSFEEIFAGIDVDIHVNIPTILASHQPLAQKYNLKWTTYEAGQHLLNQDAVDLVIAANRHPAMTQKVEAYIQTLVSLNFTMVNWFTRTGRFSKYGCWGLQEWQDSDPQAAPKLVAVNGWLDGSCPTRPSTCPDECNQHGDCLPNNVCACYDGYSGAACEITTPIDVYRCGYKCNFDRGICRFNHTEGAMRIFTCNCSDGWIGNECQVPVCPQDCNFNGWCESAYQCHCYPGFAGSACELDCGCSGHGTCTLSGTCTCSSGFTWDGKQRKCVAILSPCPACRFGKCRRDNCECWAGYSGPLCDVPVPAPNEHSSIGINLDGPCDWGTSWPFIDLMKSSRAWIHQLGGIEMPAWTYWSLKPPLALDDADNVISLDYDRAAATLMARDVQQHLPDGWYTMTWEGKGNITVGFDAGNMVVREGMAQFQVNLSLVRDNGIYLRITKQKPGRYARNIKVVMPGFDPADADEFPFHPAFLQSLEKYRAIRFMDWSGLGPKHITWQTRPRVSHQRWSHGIPVEIQILLANQLRADPWFCIPHRADNSFVKNFALLALKTLRPDVKIYVEHSNEVWNAFFDSGKYAQEMGLSTGLHTDPWQAQLRWHAQRSVEIFQIWANVFGSQRSRVVFVLGTFTTMPSVSQLLLAYKNTSKYVDALGVTTYFGGSVGDDQNALETSRLSVDQILDKVNSTTAINEVKTTIQQHVAIARSYGIKVVSYEGGPSMVESAAIHKGSELAGLTEKLIAAHRSPRIKDIYMRHLDMFAALDVQLHMQYSHIRLPSKYGAWGTKEYQLQPLADAPKLQALMEWQELHPKSN